MGSLVTPAYLFDSLNNIVDINVIASGFTFLSEVLDILEIIICIESPATVLILLYSFLQAPVVIGVALFVIIHMLTLRLKQLEYMVHFLSSLDFLSQVQLVQWVVRVLHQL